MFSFPLLLTIYAGFTHAFEADHLLAVSNIVSQRNNIKLSVKDGIYWGLGHASTIFCMGILMILFKAGISPLYFHYFETIVGLMLIGLAVYRLTKFFRTKTIIIHTHQLGHDSEQRHHRHVHSLAYGVGLVHGLAGSGALVVIVLSQMKGPIDGLTYLLIFGIGCIGGMMLASGFFSVPFSKKLMQARTLQGSLVIISSILCVAYGSKVIYENLVL